MISSVVSQIQLMLVVEAYNCLIFGMSVELSEVDIGCFNILCVELEPSLVLQKLVYILLGDWLIEFSESS